MPGDLNQSIYLGAIPDGLTLSITAVKPSVTDTSSAWSASFIGPDSRITKYGYSGYFNGIEYPFTINTAHLDGLIGRIKLTPDDGLFCTGQGGKVDITFRLHGTTVADGQPITIDEAGYISISSSEWGGLERPCRSNVTYCLQGSPPVNLSISVPTPIGTDPADALFTYAISPQNKEVGINVTTHKDVLAEVLDNAVKGILAVNPKLVGWAVKSIAL